MCGQNQKPLFKLVWGIKHIHLLLQIREKVIYGL